MECVRGAYLEEEFLRVIEVPSTMLLIELHRLIQDLIGFSDEHLEECFIATRLRGKKIRFMPPAGQEGLPSIVRPEMNLSLADVFTAGSRKKLFYSFNFGDNWIFEVKKKSQAYQSSDSFHYPRIVLQEGGKPI